MAAKSLIERFQEAFKEPEKVNAEEYQKVIEDNAEKTSQNVERLTFLLFGLEALLILVAWEQIQHLNFFGLGEIPNKSIILIALLVVVSYTQYDLLSTISKFDQLSVIYKIIVKHRHKTIHQHGLSKYFLFSPTFYEYVYSSSDGATRQIQSILRLVEFIAITILLPLGSEIIALMNLVTPANSEYSSLIVTGVITSLLFNLQSGFTTYQFFRGTSYK
jgi:hypothetical protein